MAKANTDTADETTLLDGRVRLLQPAGGLRAGLDAVMVAAAVPARADDRVQLLLVPDADHDSVERIEEHGGEVLAFLRAALKTG